jgi:hypothetical protein
VLLLLLLLDLQLPVARVAVLQRSKRYPQQADASSAALHGLSRQSWDGFCAPALRMSIAAAAGDAAAAAAATRVRNSSSLGFRSDRWSPAAAAGWHLLLLCICC